MNRFLAFAYVVYFSSGCGFRQTDVHPVNPTPNQIMTPTKAHLKNGGVVVFKNGFTLHGGKLLGDGSYYDLTRKQSRSVSEITIDSVAFLEYYTRETDAASSVAMVPPAIAGGLFLWKALFGSCPTIYTKDGTSETLEAESFSHSISPMFETDDLDRLDAGKSIDGFYRILLTNEALETHYINELGVLAVEHSSNYEVFRNQQREFVLFGAQSFHFTVQDESGTEVTSLLMSRDNIHFRSDTTKLDRLKDEIKKDHLLVQIDVPTGADHMVVAYRMKNSLFTTVLLYDVMLAGQGASALDWMSSKTSEWIYAWRLHNWFEENFGLDIAILDNGTHYQSKHVASTGPIAWHQGAETFNIAGRDSVTLDFSFLPDNWIIDWVGISFAPQESFSVRELDLVGITDASGESRPEVGLLLEEDDDDYFVTYPGQRFELTYKAANPGSSNRTSYFVRSKGYYIEWLRKHWFDGSLPFAEFQPNDKAVQDAADMWDNQKASLEELFLNTRIPLLETTRP